MLALYRPRSTDVDDPQVAEAIRLATDDKELAAWFEEHCAFQEKMRASLRSIPAPSDLKARILMQKKIVPLPVHRRPLAWLAVAAAVVAMMVLGNIYLRPKPANVFANFQSRMLGAALRDYRM